MSRGSTGPRGVFQGRNSQGVLPALSSLSHVLLRALISAHVVHVDDTLEVDKLRKLPMSVFPPNGSQPESLVLCLDHCPVPFPAWGSFRAPGFI